MKPLSESLLALAARVNRLEESAAAVEDRNETALQERRRELESTIDQEVEEFKKTTGEAKEAARSRWSDTKDAVERQVATMRADFEKRQAELAQENAERAALSAEEDAMIAMTLAGYCLDAAEWAVVGAELARGERAVPDLTGRVREIIEDHRPARHVDDAEASCSCGAEALSDHPHHVAQQIIDRLGLKPETVDDATKRIRYATAWFNSELTKFEGAQC